MQIKTTKAGMVQVVINGETFDVIAKGEQDQAGLLKAAEALTQLADYGSKVAALEEQKAKADAEMAALKSSVPVASAPAAPAVPAGDADSGSVDPNSPF